MVRRKYSDTYKKRKCYHDELRAKSWCSNCLMKAKLLLSYGRCRACEQTMGITRQLNNKEW